MLAAPLAQSADSPAVPVAVRIVLFAVLAAPGIAVGLVGWQGLRGRLVRNRFAGVRTAASMRSDESFALANRVAGAPQLAGGLIGLIGGALAASMPTTGSAFAVLFVAIAGLLVLVLAAGVLGNRAAAALPEPVEGCSTGGGCAGCTALCGQR